MYHFQRYLTVECQLTSQRTATLPIESGRPCSMLVTFQKSLANWLRFFPPDDICCFFPLAFGPFQNTHGLDLRILLKEYYSPLGNESNMFQHKFRNLKTTKNEKSTRLPHSTAIRFSGFIVAVVLALRWGQDHSRDRVWSLLTPWGCCDYVGIFRNCKEEHELRCPNGRSLSKISPITRKIPKRKYLHGK